MLSDTILNKKASKKQGITTMQNLVSSMEKAMTIRLVTEKDAAEILEVYTPYVTETAITFDYEPPTVEEFEEKIRDYSQNYPWLVIEENNRIIGYAYGSKHRTKQAYQWSPESTIYLSKQVQGKKIGRILYQTLFDLLRIQGFVNVYAGVTIPNEKSEAIHLSLGFEETGDFKKMGYKMGKWHDVRWYVLYLAEHISNPPSPLLMAELYGNKLFNSIMKEANKKLNQNINS